MKQIVQALDTGETKIIEAPAPMASRGTLLVATTTSLISSGTERMLVDFGKAGLIAKARQQPQRVKDVLAKMRTDGVLTTIEAVRSKLGQPIPLGYCNVGRVTALGAGVEGYAIGDRVVSNGPHADLVRVPVNLTAKILDGVSDEAAAFTVVAAIGLQGIRLAQPTLGEAFVVTGAGLIGLLTIQLLRAQGARVLAIDFDEAKLTLARRYGAETCNPAAGEDPIAAGMRLSRGRGVDGVIITASTKSNDPVSQAAKMSRQRGRIVLVGVVGLALDRADFYEKELSFQVSCSYGPGRYDPSFEQDGNDYPIGFVRWTEQRNFEAVLDMMADGRIDTAALVSRRFAFADAADAYAALTEDKSGLGLVLEYDEPLENRATTRATLAAAPTVSSDAPVIGVIGAGNYAGRVLIPAFKAAGARLATIVASGGLSSTIVGGKAGFATAASDAGAVIGDPTIDVAVIATRHDSHARLTAAALAAGKHVFVEKPLGLTTDDIDLVERQVDDARAHGRLPQLMVGFNRRFAPTTVKMKALLDRVNQPKALVLTVNAGAIPPDHWTQDRDVGGGRIIGEACHFIDLARFLAGHPIMSIDARRMGDAPGLAVADDKAVITLGFADGSLATIAYLANGSNSFPKERIEAFAGGRILQIDNFRRLNGFGWRGVRGLGSFRQDKGQSACVTAFLTAVQGGASAIPLNELFEVARATIEAARQLRDQQAGAPAF